MKKVARFFSGPVMALAGVNHFVMPKAYAAIVPDYLPRHLELVYASGVAETLSALLTMHPRTRRMGGVALIATLLAVFPANVHMAVHPESYPQIPGGRTSLLLRLPLQALFVYWVWLATLSEEAS